MIDPKLIIKLYKEKRIKRISERMYDVDSKNVFFQIKKGRKVLLCSCKNESRFPNESFCFHKEAVIGFELINYLFKKLDKKIETIESLKYSKDKEKSFEIALKELKEIRELRI